MHARELVGLGRRVRGLDPIVPRSVAERPDQCRTPGVAAPSIAPRVR
jgi:hypothetical protein